MEVCEVIAAVCAETSTVKSNQLTVSSKLRHNGKPSMDVAVSVLVKLVIDMYVQLLLLSYVYYILSLSLILYARLRKKNSSRHEL